MKEYLHQFDRAFENRIRLGIMSALAVNEWISYVELKRLLGTSDGNLASHLRYLEKKDFIQYKKGFQGRKPITHYQVTPSGQQAFNAHVEALEKLLNQKKFKDGK